MTLIDDLPLRNQTLTLEFKVRILTNQKFHTFSFHRQYLTKYSYWRRRGIKGPTPLPFFGNTLESFFRDIRDVDLGRPQKYGQVYGLYMGTIPVLTICDPEIIKHIAIKDAQNFTDVNAFRMRQKVGL